MTNRFLISVAALALIAGTGAASAQGTGARESGGAAMQSAPSSAGGGAATQNQGTQPSSGMNSTAPEKLAPGAAKGQHAQESAPGQKSKGMSSETETKGGKDMKAETREGQSGNMKAEGREGRDNMKVEGREGRDNKMNAEGREDRNGKMNAETKSGTDRSQVTTGQAGAGAKISTEQRTKITTVIRNERVAPVDHVNFSISVGTRVPREGVTFRPLPAEVVTIYPEWRGYEFFLVRDQIIVVDPRTLEIVAILEA
jgi:Protein of unknown function (DUF1236)